MLSLYDVVRGGERGSREGLGLASCTRGREDILRPLGVARPSTAMMWVL